MTNNDSRLVSLRSWAAFCIVVGIPVSTAMSHAGEGLGRGLVAMGIIDLAACWIARRGWKPWLWLLVAAGFASCGALTVQGALRTPRAAFSTISPSR